MKAVVAGAAGGIGQPLSLLLKLSPLVDELSLYDIFLANGVATDLSHISTPASVAGFPPSDNGLDKTLKGADIVIIPAGIPRKPGMSRDELFDKNATIVRDLIAACAKNCPDAYILVISNPVNSTVPIAAETLKAAGKFNPKKLFGVTTLDVVRAETFLRPFTADGKTQVNIPVVGGHSGATIVPLFSQAKPAVKIPEDQHKDILKRIQFGGDEVVQAKDGAGSATLSMAYAGFRFAESIMKAAKGETGLVEPSFVYLRGIPGGDALADATGCEFFSAPIELGRDGATKVVDLVSKADSAEKELLDACYAELKGSITKGEAFVKASPPS